MENIPFKMKKEFILYIGGISLFAFGFIFFVWRIPLASAMGRKPHFLQSNIVQSYKQATVFRWPSIQNDV